MLGYHNEKESNGAALLGTISRGGLSNTNKAPLQQRIKSLVLSSTPWEEPRGVSDGKRGGVRRGGEVPRVNCTATRGA